MASEAFAVPARWDSDETQEGAPHRFRSAEPALDADRLEPVRRLLEQPARGLDANGGDETGRGRPDFAGEDPSEVARAHRHPAGQGLDREIRLRVIDDVRL